MLELHDSYFINSIMLSSFSIEKVRVRETYECMDDLNLSKKIEQVYRVSLTFITKEEAAKTIRVLTRKTSQGSLSSDCVEKENRVSSIEQEKFSKSLNDFQNADSASLISNQLEKVLSKFTQRASALKVHKSCHRGEKVRCSKPCRAGAVMTRVTHDG